MRQGSRRGRAPSPRARPHADAETGPARPDPCRMPIAVKPAGRGGLLDRKDHRQFRGNLAAGDHGSESEPRRRGP